MLHLHFDTFTFVQIVKVIYIIHMFLLIRYNNLVALRGYVFFWK